MQLPRSTSRFALEARVGGGAMGDVYRAIDNQTNELVAIKLVRPSASRDEKARFRREIQVLLDLRHPNVVQYVDHGVWTDGRAFLAMEWLEGEDLQARTRNSPLGMNDAVEVVRRASMALAAVHARGVVHRDLKLSNIWLLKGRGLHVKLIDFGVVKLPEPDDYTTEPGAIIGSPHYMAPEQARGDPVTPKSDVYALGAVLFRLVTGRVIFPTEHVVALLGQLVLEDPPLASAVRFDIPPALDRVIASSIARSPDDRFGEAGELARALARVGDLSNEPPGKETSASSVRRVTSSSSTAIPAQQFADAPSESMGRAAAPGVAERRIIATVVATVEGPLPAAADDALRALLREGDQLQPVQGQRLLLAFGVKQTSGDEILRAARAALVLATMAPNARVAIASGQATRRSRGISADALERAAVQLDHAAIGGVRVDAATAPLLAGRFVLREDAVGAVLLHEDAGVLASRKLLGRPTPTVGREKEISLLAAVFGESLEERAPRAAIVVGQPGIGKSRIRYELLHRLAKDPAAPEVLVCRGDPMTARGGISSVGRALRAVLGVRDGEPAAEQESKVRRYVEQRRSAGLHAPDVAEFLGEVVGVHFDAARSEPLRAARQNPVLMQTRVRGAFEAIVRSDSRRAPQVIVIEDLHWADEATVDLLGWVLGSQDIRFVVYGFARPTLYDRAPLWEARSVTRLEVAPLSSVASEKLVSGALPDATAATRRRLVERAGGNALFLEELIRHAAEGKDDLPLTVQSLIQTRLDALGTSLRQVARAASVFGRSCWTDGVAALVGRDVDLDLDLLTEAEVLSPADTSRISDQREWIFRHGLVRDAVYASLVEEDAAMLHAKAGSWLEAVGEEDAAMIAPHALLGGDRTRAAKLYAKATAQAYVTGSMDAVLSLAEKGLECADDEAMRARLLLSKAQVATWLARYDTVTEAAGMVLTIAAPGTPDWADASRLLANVLREQGNAQEAELRLESALSFARGYEPGTLSMLLSEHSRTLSDLGRVDEARHAADLAMDHAMRAGSDRETARLRAVDARFLVIALAQDVAEMTTVCRSVIQLADAAGDIPLAARGRCNLGYSLTIVGLLAPAREVLERAAKDARELRILSLEGYVLHNLGLALARSGDHDGALESLRNARRCADELGQNRLRAAALQYEALALAWRGGPGDLASALTVAREAEAAATGQPWLQAEAKRILSYVQFLRGAIHASLELSADVLAGDESSQGNEFDELARLARVEGLLAVGDEEEADAVLRDAHARLLARARSMSSAEERAGYLQNLTENRRLLDLGAERLGLRSEP